MSSASRSGTLHVVATPIGNMGDLTARAIDVLGSVVAIACEDTRRTGLLLDRVGVRAPRLLVVDEHRERDAVGEVVALLADGGDVALVSDAGTPLVSDPGVPLVRAVLEEGFAVLAVPGASALLAALVVSGIDTDRFCFEGFLPRRGAERERRIREIVAADRTVVLYEAPHRVVRTVGDLAAAAGADRRVAVCRELTKLHEEVWRGTLGDALEAVGSRTPRGEYVLVVERAPEVTVTDGEVAAALRAALEKGATRRSAVEQVSADLGVGRRRVYSICLSGDL